MASRSIEAATACSARLSRPSSRRSPTSRSSSSERSSASAASRANTSTERRSSALSGRSGGLEEIASTPNVRPPAVRTGAEMNEAVA